jgi:transposase
MCDSVLMRTGVEIQLSPEDRARLERLAADRNTPQKHAWRARIVLLSGEGVGTMEIMRRTGQSKPTVWRWQARFAAEGVAGLLRDKTRPPGRQPLASSVVEQVVTKTTTERPPDATHWTARAMARAVGIAVSSVQKIWQAHGLKPHLVRRFKLSNDPAFAEKLVDIVGLYMNPPDRALVLAVDEKSQIQALDRTQPGLPLKRGRAGTMTHDYKRHGTTTLFAALNVLDGTVIGRCAKRHRHQEFIRFLRVIDESTPADLDLHLVVDNYATHKHPAVKAWLAQHPHVHLHFTPTSASWLNLVERFFAEITEKRIRRGAFRSVAALERAIMEYLEHHNASPKPFVWTATADMIFRKIEKVCERTSNSGH